MANGRLLRQLAKTGAEGDVPAFLQAFQEVIKEEREKQHHQLANDLEKILKGKIKNEPIPLRRYIDAPPTDRDGGMPLCEVREPERTLDEMVLSEENADQLEKLMREYFKEDLLRSHNLRPSSRLLFYGPPGCGKSVTAEVLAKELGRPLVIVRIDAVVTSLLGETASNMRKIFDYISTNTVVALFDEFDAFSKERSDASEHGELKRVVNTLLQMMDDYKGKSLIIATTNHESMLDMAIWRRFEDVLFFDYPTVDQIASLIKLRLRTVRKGFSQDLTDVATLFLGLSYADIERILLRAVKNMILRGEETLELTHIKTSLDQDRARMNRMRKGKDGG